MDDKTRVLEHAVAFLRMAAIQLRNMTERAPDIADQLRHTADGLDREASACRPPATELEYDDACLGCRELDPAQKNHGGQGYQRSQDGDMDDPSRQDRHPSSQCICRKIAYKAILSSAP
jgi:hypothetical protein